MTEPSRAGRVPAGKTIALALAAGIGIASCGPGEEPGALPREESPVEVTVSPSVTLAGEEGHPATVAASREARIATRNSGRIVEIPVDVGSRVRAGETLAVLDDGDVRARIEAAEAGARIARRTWERVRALAAEGAASEHELDGARAAMEAAEAELRAARAQLAYTVLTAPFPGSVVARGADPGELAAPGAPILTLVSGEGRKVRADLPASLAGEVEVGDRARIPDPGGGPELRVRISRVVPAVSEASRRFRVEAELPAGTALLPGTAVTLHLPGAGEPTRWIPGDAVVRRGQLTGVYTVEEGRLALRWVRLGLIRPGAVELLAGPAGPVVREPGPGFYDGRPVDAVREEAWGGPEAAVEERGR